MALAFWQHRTTTYSVLRNSLIGSTAVALLLHLVVPMAPPRMLPGFVDAGAAYGPDPYAIAGSESANQFAAMPSLHVAWAVLIGCTLWRLTTWRIVRSLAVLHPLVTALVVIITGHHFVADVGIGAALAIAFVAISSGRSAVVGTRIQRPEEPDHLLDATRCVGDDDVETRKQQLAFEMDRPVVPVMPVVLVDIAGAGVDSTGDLFVNFVDVRFERVDADEVN